MSLQEQLEKVQSDLQKIEERRKELQQKVLFGKLNAAVSIRLKRVFQST